MADPVRISTASPPAAATAWASVVMLNIVIGISVAFFTNYLILQLGKSDAAWAQNLHFAEWNWRWMLGLETLPAVLYFFGLFLVPRSPRWLVMKGELEEALEVMKRAAGEQSAEEELEKIRLAIKNMPDNRAQVTVSIGIGHGHVGRKVDADVKDLIHKADENLLKAKGQGRNCIQL